MNTMVHEQQLNSVFQTLTEFNLIELDQIMNHIIGLRKQKLPSVLSRTETDLLRKINADIPVEIRKRYDFLLKKRKGETLNDIEYKELLELTAYTENQNVVRLGYLIDLAKVRNKTLDEILLQLEIKPRLYVA